MLRFIILFILFASTSAQSTIFSNSVYDSIDTSSIPSSAKNAFKKAFEAADYQDHDNFKKKRWIMVVDFTQNSKHKRGYLIDLKKKRFLSFHVSHGINSGDGKGNAVAFSNVNGSLQSSLGLYITAETYRGKHGKSLRLKGLSPTNDLAYERAIVLHSADYAQESVATQQGFLGVSEGCPAVGKRYIRRIIRRLNSKNYLYTYHEIFSNF